MKIFASLLAASLAAFAAGEFQVPPIVPVVDPISGLVGHQIQAVTNCPYGLQVGSHWIQASVDYEGSDAVLLYARDAFAPYGPADMARVSSNRLWNFGPAIGTPEKNSATFTFSCNRGVARGVSILPNREEITLFDALSIHKRSNEDRYFLHLGQGDTTQDWRIGYVDGALCFYHASGKPSDPAHPGRLVAKLDARGNLWLKGIVKENTLP